jgi:hypothetical protein
MSSASFIFRILGGDLECVAGMNGDHTTRLDPGLFASLGVVAWAWSVVASWENPDPRDVHGITTLERQLSLIETGLLHVRGLRVFRQLLRTTAWLTLPLA